MAITSDHSVRFALDGHVVSAEITDPTLTLLEYLRLQAGRTGTKEGCAEGDCGACTVVLGELNSEGGIDYRAVNSCIRFLATIDGRELVTVESLQHGTTLHPVQQAMVDCFGSQCGFCTPGFVMSLFALYQQPSGQPSEHQTGARAELGRTEVVNALSGNLCRCTGYRPIIDAGCRIASYPEPARWNRDDARSADRVARLAGLQRDTALKLPGFHAPRSSAEFAAAYQAAPDSLILAGGTDIGLWVTKHLRELPPMLYIGEVAELQQIAVSDQGIEIGAAVSLTAAWAAIVELIPQLDELANRFASPPVRNSGTLCGNLANGSPIGDAMPALIALGADIELRCGDSIRRLPLERFYLGYQKKDLQPGEFLTSVRIPKPAPGLIFESYKLSKRIDQDISAVCAAFAITLAGDTVSSARIAFGGMAATPARAPATEASLIGQPFTAATITAAAAKLADDYTPLSDMRASSGYRLQTAMNLLKRFHLQHSGSDTVLRTDEAAL
ncbi:MAG: xanthine dehydrogenase small subunit [Nevskia sp.]|nr:xanthine dehydrogenase small subunit [Nevskia sp.]